MPDEVSTGELARRLDRIELLLQGQITRNEYNTQLGHIERRFTDLEADIADVRARLDSANTQSGTNVRQAIYSGLVPGILFLVSILITISQSRGK